MSNLVFPSELPGIKIEMSRTAVWKTTVHESVSGCETAIGSMTYPKWRYKLEFEVLRAGAEAELQQLVGFFNRHGGRADTWLFLDEEDHTVVDQQFGLGDGVTTTFYLYRESGGFVEPVTDIKTISGLTIPPTSADSLSMEFSNEVIDIGEGLALTIFKNNYTYAGGGMIQFATPPAAGVPLRWSGEFYRRCRFKDDMLNADRFLYHLWKVRAIEFDTSRRAA